MQDKRSTLIGRQLMKETLSYRPMMFFQPSLTVVEKYLVGRGVESSGGDGEIQFDWIVHVRVELLGLDAELSGHLDVLRETLGLAAVELAVQQVSQPLVRLGFGQQQGRHEVDRQSVPQNRLHKHTQRLHVDPRCKRERQRN